jgi:hypothetical protein
MTSFVVRRSCKVELEAQAQQADRRLIQAELKTARKEIDNARLVAATRMLETQLRCGHGAEQELPQVRKAWSERVESTRKF